MANINTVIVEGRLTDDSKFFEAPDGTKVCTFSIAVNGRKDSQADFFPLALYGKYGEKMSEKLKKGVPVLITGCLRQNKWKNAEERTVSETVISVYAVKLLVSGSSSKKQNEVQAEPAETIEDEACQIF